MFAEDGAFHQWGGGVLCAPDFDGFVAYNLGVGVGGVDVVSDGVLAHGGVVDGVDSATLPIGVDAVEEAVEGVELLQRTEDIDPTEGEEVTVGFLVGASEVGHAKAEGDEVVVLIDDEMGEVEVDEGEVFLDIDVNFLIGEWNEVVEVLEGVVEGVEELLGVGEDVLAMLEFEESEVVFLKDEAVDASDFVGNRLVGWKFVLSPLAFLLHTVAFYETDVVFGVVESGDVLSGVETLDDPTLFVHIGESEGSFDLVHAVIAAEGDDSVHESGEDGVVVDEVHPAEADGFFLPALVAAVVDDGGDAADEIVVAIGEIHLEIAILAGGVFLGEELDLVGYQGRDVGGDVLEESVRELDELVEFPTRGNRAYFNH